MKKLTTLTVSILIAVNAMAAPVWTLSPKSGITLDPKEIQLPYYDHIEMSGQMMSAVIRWGVDEHLRFVEERSLVFPMLRRVPNDTHASLMHRIATDVPSLVSVNGLSLKNERVSSVEIDGLIRVSSTFAVGKANIGLGTGTAPKPAVELVRTIFPSVDKPLLAETYTLRNVSDKVMVVYVPEFSQSFKTLPEKGVDGTYVVRADLTSTGTFTVQPGGSIDFGAVFQAYRLAEQPLEADAAAELLAREALVANFDSSLVLETPDERIDREFRFAKIRASESIYRTRGGLMHGPGGESYYAALWCNDECEYVNPFYPFSGYEVGNASALNCYLHYARFANDGYAPIPSSIIAEGTDIWDGAGDRGDAAMVAHGASRYVLARGDRAEAGQLWPFIKWCLEYCHRKLNAQGVPESDSDELEGRFPSGSANLSTACLYYDGLVSASYLAPLMGEPAAVARTYRRQADELRKSIGSYFGANVGGYETYRYYDGNDLLRSWICLPLCFGINDRAEGTLAALFSPEMMTVDGILTQQGSTTFWDRSTLYALRGAFAAGYADEALVQLANYSERRLLGVHVPYPVEAYPEGSQRHLSAESGLYCRIITEGLFGIRPTGFDSFSLKPQLPSSWDTMSLRRVKAFGGSFDITVKRISGNRLEVVVADAAGEKKYTLTAGQEIKKIKINR